MGVFDFLGDRINQQLWWRNVIYVKKIMVVWLMIYGCNIGEMNFITNKRGYDDKWGSYEVLWGITSPTKHAVSNWDGLKRKTYRTADFVSF